MTIINSQFLKVSFTIILTSAVVPCFAQPQDVYRSCEIVSAKISLYYDLETRIGSEFPTTDKFLKKAELIADVAYGKPRKQLRKLWPGLYEWSVLAATSAFERQLSSQDFKTFSMLECLRRFG